MDGQTKLSETVDTLADFSAPAYDALPEIDLYMDQVTGYLNKLLCRVCRAEDDAPLTGSRINNYVKGGYVARPVHKKYGKEQLAMLYMLCYAKQNLSIPEVAALLGLYGEESIEQVYTRFGRIHSEAVQAAAREVQGAEDLREKAMELLLRSTAERYLAEEIIASLAVKEAAPAKEKKEKKSKKEKANKERTE